MSISSVLSECPWSKEIRYVSLYDTDEVENRLYSSSDTIGLNKRTSRTPVGFGIEPRDTDMNDLNSAGIEPLGDSGQRPIPKYLLNNGFYDFPLFECTLVTL